MKGVVLKGLKITGKVLYLLLLVVSAIIVEAVNIFFPGATPEEIEEAEEFHEDNVITGGHDIEII